MGFHGEISLTYEDGVFRPDSRVALPNGARVRARISKIPDAAESRRAMEEIRRIRASGAFRSGGRKFTRDEMHERR